ncbi:pentapeptide repeat-containing protein [Dactylosporangium roseum]|uniref:Pentapeptide repeat-containing protein n=1 Tax=Dactylosporangium roseum TaxID=47989 RepID=A0ABY5YZI5_9ACTN|nr:pentapeptide repeat-containing protein [Dactylosporangium roseum]UWZ35170.1 pentapeptide repeat-containing protein [Dactylosporangium roseum]
MPAAQSLEDLAYAAYLREHGEPLEPDGNYTEVHLSDVELEDVHAGHATFIESAFTGVVLGGGSLERSRFSDVWISRNRWVGLRCAEAEWLDVTVLDSSLAGIEAYGSRLRRVIFQRCKIDTLNLRGATVADVEFDGCDLTELDCGGATLTNVTFAGSAVRRARFAGAKLKKVDFRGARELDVADGADSLRGAIVDDRQLLELAPVLAAALGIEVR